MYQCHQKLVFVQVRVDCDFMLSAQGFAIIAVACDTLVHDFQMHFIRNNQFENRFYGMLWQISG